MKSPDSFIGFESNLIFNGKSAEDFSFSENIKNRLSFGCPCSRQRFNFWEYRSIGLGQQTRSADYDFLAAYECLCPSPGQRLKLGSLQNGELSALSLGHNCLTEWVFGVDFYGGSAC